MEYLQIQSAIRQSPQTGDILTQNPEINCLTTLQVQQSCQWCHDRNHSTQHCTLYIYIYIHVYIQYFFMTIMYIYIFWNFHEIWGCKHTNRHLNIYNNTECTFLYPVVLALNEIKGVRGKSLTSFWNSQKSPVSTFVKHKSPRLQACNHIVSEQTPRGKY